MPGVVSASIGWNPPYYIGRNFFTVPGHDAPPVEAGATAAAPRFFETLGERVVSGREFDGSDNDIQNGLIINTVLADKLWPHANAVGQMVNYGTERRVVTGVVSEPRCRDITSDPEPCAYRPFPMGGTSGYIRVRTQGDPIAMVENIRRLIHDAYPNAALAEERPLTAYLADLSANQRISAVSAAALAFVGIALLAAGCISLFVSMVRDSSREIAIRMALGASNRKLAARILTQGGVLTLTGVAIGMAGSIAISKQLADQLFSVRPDDALTFVAVPLLVFAIGVISVYWSAIIAARTDPARSLRGE
jgi:putative ABC transport system permease protein